MLGLHDFLPLSSVSARDLEVEKKIIRRTNAAKIGGFFGRKDLGVLRSKDPKKKMVVCLQKTLPETNSSPLFTWMVGRLSRFLLGWMHPGFGAKFC